jgi:5-oxoprolinase (ATP-hydrolysing)
VRQTLDEAQVRTALQQVADAGINSVAVVLKHAALYPDHESAVGRIATGMGFKHVSLSHVVMPMVKMVPRGFTAAADAYLTPHIQRYLHTFQSGFDAGLKDVELIFMQSDGGLSPADTFSGHKAVLSGPAAGYVGYAATTRWEGMDTSQPLQVCNGLRLAAEYRAVESDVPTIVCRTASPVHSGPGTSLHRLSLGHRLAGHRL